MNKLSKDNIVQIIELNKQGKLNTEICKIFGVNDETIRYHLKRNGLYSNHRSALKIINETQAICKKCGKIELIDKFQFIRKNKPDECKMSYCNECRKDQSYKALNRSIEARLKDKFNRLKLRAKKYNIPFDLDFKYFVNIFYNQSGKCFYTDEEMKWNVNCGIRQNALSIDKIVPENGYVKGNVVFCCHRINTSKNSLSLEEMKKWMPEWYNRICIFLQKLP